MTSEEHLIRAEHHLEQAEAAHTGGNYSEVEQRLLLATAHTDLAEARANQALAAEDLWEDLNTNDDEEEQ